MLIRSRGEYAEQNAGVNTKTAEMKEIAGMTTSFSLPLQSMPFLWSDVKNACCMATASRRTLSYLLELRIRSAVLENGKKVLTMSLDITIKERKEFRCPDCGRLVTTQDIDTEDSGGRVWYDFLEPIGYYVPYENRTEENDWYGEDMVLTEEQAKQLADFVSDNQPYNARNVECLVARALLHGNKVVINADW